MVHEIIDIDFHKTVLYDYFKKSKTEMKQY